MHDGTRNPRGSQATSRVAIYIRVSTRMQVERYSLDDQLQTCLAYAEHKGWDVVEIYADKGVSGRRDERPELQRLKRDAQRKAFDVVLVFKLNRFARNVPAQYAVAAELERYGVAIVSATEAFERKTAAGKLTFGMLAVIAQFDSDQQSERVASAKREQARRGDWVGPVPYGYERDGKTLKPSADAAAVQLAFRLYATGMHSYLSIADELNHQGYHTFDSQTKERGIFGRENVRGILQNPAYIGHVRCKEVECAGKHLPLIDRETWDRCQALRESRKAKGGYSNVQEKTGRLLSGLARCGACGAPMWAHPSSNAYYYRCAGREHRTCNAATVRAEIVEAQALELVHTLALPGEWQQEILRQAEALCQPRVAKPTVSKTMIEAHLKRLALVYAAGDLDETTYRAERDRLRQRLEENGEAAHVSVWDAQRAAALLSDIGDLLDGANEAERRAALRYLFAALWLERHRIVALTPTALYEPMLAVVETLRVKEGWLGCLTGFEPATS
jgi:site-specific DNA recombinase